VTSAQSIGRNFYDLAGHLWNVPALRELLDNILPRDQIFEEFAMDCDIPAVGRRKMLLNGRRVVGEANEPPLILLALEDVGAA